MLTVSSTGEQKEAVVAALEADLSGPEYVSGDFFASVSEVRRRFAVSHGVAAAAMARLVNDGRLIVRPGKGHYVV